MPPFDPYLNWLGISPHEQPPNFYRLLGVILFEANPGVIAQAADRQMYHVATFQSGPNADASQHLLNELAMARACLLDPEQKASYDGYLQELLAQRGERAVMAPPPPAGMSAAPYGQAGGQMSPPMSPMGNGYGVGANGYPPAYGEVPLPQFPLPPQAPQPGAASPMQGMPMPMPQMQPMQQMPVQSSLPDMQYMPQQMPMPQQVPQQFAMPGPMPMQGAMPGFMPVPQPMPAPLGMQGGYAPQAAPQQPSPPRAAQAKPPAPAPASKKAAPKPPAPAPPVDPLAELTASSRPRRRFVRKKQDYSKEMMMGGIVAAVIAVIVLIFLTVNGLDDEKRGMERIADDKAKVFGGSPADKQLVKEAPKKKSPKTPASSFLPPQGTPHANVTVRPLRPNRNDAEVPYTPRTFDAPNSRDDAPARPALPGHPHDGPGNDDDVLGPPEK